MSALLAPAALASLAALALAAAAPELAPPGLAAVASEDAPGGLAPRVRFEHPVPGGGAAALVLVDRGRRCEVWVEARIPPRVTPEAFEAELGAWTLSDGREALDGRPIGKVELRLAPPEPGDDELGTTRYRSSVYTLETGDLAPIRYAAEWSIAGQTHRDEGRADGLAPGARLLGWTRFEHAGLVGRASFWEGRGWRCAVHLELGNATTESVVPEPAEPVLRRTAHRFTGEARDRVKRLPAPGRAAGGADAEASRAAGLGALARGLGGAAAEDAAGAWEPGELRRWILPVELRRTDAEERPQLEGWSVTATLPGAGAEPRTLELGWRRSTGIAIGE